MPTITKWGNQDPARRSPMQTEEDIRVLILATKTDAELVEIALGEAGNKFTALQVDGENSFARALDDFAPHLIIADATLSPYDGCTALVYTRRVHPEIPVVIIGRRVGEEEEEVVELLRGGASDYVAKDRLSRLGLASLSAMDWEAQRWARSRARHATIVSEIRYRRLFESAKDGILILDVTSGKILDANPFIIDLLGYTREDFLGKLPWNIGVFKDEAANQAAFAELQKMHYIRYDNLPLQTKDGKSVEVEFVSNVYREDDQNVIQCNIRDLTDRHAMEKKLIHAQKMEALGTITGGLAHDFNNILGVIIGNLDLARPEVGGEVDELIGNALGAAVSGAQLTRRLLAFASNQPLQPEQIDVNAIVSGMTKIIERTLGDDINITLNLKSNLWPVMTDASQLEATVLNLANNARDAMPRGGQLTISTENRHLDDGYVILHPTAKAGDFTMIAVGDDGIGMSHDIIARIFDPFFTTKNRADGTGLGLSMVFGFIKQCGGHIDVCSEVGAGTTFRLYFPRADHDETAAMPSREEHANLGRGETVLVVDDNAQTRNIVQRQLKKLGYTVLLADGPAAALALLSTERVDLLFTDVVMPGGMTGFELARDALATHRSLKILIVSGFPDMKLNGGQAFTHMRLLNKPYRVPELARTLREIFDA